MQPDTHSDRNLQAILDHLKRIESRLDRLEAAQGQSTPVKPAQTPSVPPQSAPPIAPAPPMARPLPPEVRGVTSAAPPVSPRPAPPTPVPPAPVAAITTPPVVPPPPPPPAPSIAPPTSPTSAPPTSPSIAPPPVITVPVVAPHRAEAFRAIAAPERPAPKKSMSLEWLIGTKGLAAAGALAVVIGVIFFLKYAVEQGWISQLPPIVRCLAGVAFGGALVGAGEMARRRINSLAAAGLYAAGIACAYASTYAGYGYFNPPVIPQSIAFIALAAISALGITLSATTRLASVAIVSLVGAYLAPFLMASRNANPLVFPVYAGALLATGLILSAWLRGSFVWVGRSVWWATMLIGGGWAAFALGDHPLIVICFVLAVWAMIHTAHIVAARGQFVSDEDRDKPLPAKPFFSNPGPMLSSFSVTGWTTVLATLALRSINPAIDWLAPCGMTAATGTLAVWLAEHLGVIRNRPRTDSERLGASLALQSASALIGAVALATSSSGPAAALLWLCMGLAAVLTGRWVRALSATIYGIVLMSIGTTRLVLWDSWTSNLWTTSATFGGLTLSPWMAWATGAAAVWIAAAWVISLGTPGGRRSIWGALTAGIGVALLAGAAFHPRSEVHAMTWVYLGLPLLLLCLHKARPALALHISAIVLLTLTSVKIFLADVMIGRTPTGAPHLLGLPITQGLVLCIAAAAVWAVFAFAARAMIGRHPHAIARATACAMAAIIMLLLAPISQDVVHSHMVWPWALTAVAASLAARFERRIGLRIGAAIAASLSVVAWLVAWVIAPGFTHWETSYPPLLHPGLLASIAAAAALISVAKVARPTLGGPLDGPESDDMLALVAFITAGVLAWLASSFEASRLAEMVTGSAAARGAAVSIWWGLLAVSLLLIGFRRSLPALRYTGLSLLGAAGVKVVLMDMADAPQLARVAGFVTLGLLMLGTAVGYARVAKLIDAQNAARKGEQSGAP